MQDKIYSLLGLAARAGRIVSGSFSTEESVRSRKACLVILAEDSQTNTAKRIKDKCSYYRVPVVVYGSKDGIGHAVGRAPRACAAITDRGIAQSIIKKMTDGPGGNSLLAGQSDLARQMDENGRHAGESGQPHRNPATEQTGAVSGRKTAGNELTRAAPEQMDCI